MNEVFVEVVVKGDPAQLEIILAQLNEGMDIEGVEESEGYLKFYFKKEYFKEEIFKNLIDINNINYSISNVNNKNWNAIWESDFQPVVVNGFASIRADFHPANNDVAYDIIVTPKMSFGTGHHATTHMMIEMMQDFSPAGKEVIDFGTGTGVLAILAVKMKASLVTAIDYDAWSIANAEENFEKNHTPGITLLQLDHFPGNLSADLVLANINRNVITDNLHRIAGGLKPDGTLLISGILQSDIPDIQKLMKEAGFEELKGLLKNNWACLAFKKLIKG